MAAISAAQEGGSRVSRGYKARQKAKRRRVYADSQIDSQHRSKKRGRGRASHRANERRLAIAHTRPAGIAVAGLAIAACLAIAVGALATGSRHGPDAKQIDREIGALLHGIPQKGATLGAPTAPITLQFFGDMECRTVKRFVLAYLPAIINELVRNSVVKIEYRSLKTDTLELTTFLRQETGALAAGRQNKMWNFIETFIHEQGKEYTPYATDKYLTNIARQVPSLNIAEWAHDRADSRLSKQVMAGESAARRQSLQATPSFLIGRTGKPISQLVGTERKAGWGTLISAGTIKEAIQWLH